MLGSGSRKLHLVWPEPVLTTPAVISGAGLDLPRVFQQL